MAEIKIEQKKQMWPWILVVLIIAALLLYFLMFRDNDKNTEAVTEDDYITDTNEPTLVEVKENNLTVSAFVSFVENDTTRMSLDHAYTNEALLKLTAATNAMATEIGYDVQADLVKLEESANQIESEPFETSHAGNIKHATESATTALQNMQRAEYPELTNEVDELKSASASINPEELTLEQKVAVKNYFAKASDLLKKMN